MEVVREVLVDRPVAEVFAFVADARNDTRWCPKVESVEQVEGEGPGAGARYAVVHKPVPLRPARRMDMSCRVFEPPKRVEWREDDGTDLFEVTYELEPAGQAATRMRQRSEFELGAPRFLQPLFRHGIGRDVAGQLKALKRVLEANSNR